MSKTKKPRVQHVLRVEAKKQLSPHMTRVVFGGPGFDAIEFKSVGESPATDQYVKLLFLPAALERDPSAQQDVDLSRPFDMEALREQLPTELMPVTRTYTIRHVDHLNSQIWVDFVVHGDEGLAGVWAQNAQPGDLISFFGPGSAYAPRGEADWHLLAGDEAALPAIASALESMDEDARGVAVVEIRDESERQPLTVPAGVDLVWLHREADFSPETTMLADYLAELSIPDGDVQVFVHGEREQTKRIRRLLVEDKGLPRKGMSLSAYWAHGRIEDQFQAEKRTPVGQIDPD
ncbi:siderophore-interacting protein [Nesterenkonia halotolerans]|uniref:NADPH-dependent ferric siderophore reductase n=1 Tax=Nesterenkonia halotolerans TaxID=225325 RepID=A0ABR9J5B3_9MICC|nr:siderophore-interacting protein [Nesterenkonia halotolerans]MBE1514186.1 NADPH-dependent ferric siderophore reductase [Nesterenkonia halotolerans]